MKVAKKRAAAKWIAANQGEVAKFFNVSISAVQLWVKSGMPGRPGRYPLDKIAQWRDTRTKTTANSSIGLEKGRELRASLAELELEERRGRLCDIAVVNDVMERFFGLLRGLNEQCTKRFGREANELFTETLDECEKVIDDLSNGSSAG